MSTKVINTQIFMSGSCDVAVLQPMPQLTQVFFMADIEQCDHRKLEKRYFEEPIDEIDYHGIWNVQTSSFYTSVSALVSIGIDRFKCTECGKMFDYSNTSL